ncbi:MAG: AFG1 family ATPase [Steroidobacteraceae bacterium]|nr:AFG1 family ATPase [Steroidobacteraceae bacterium]
MTGRSYAVEAPRMTRRADLQKEYEAALVRHGYRPDPAQQHAVDRLSDLAVRLRGAENRSKAGFFGRWRTQAGRRGGSAAGERGVYLWGGVGRGKTFLMDLFHAHVGVPTQREHFHRLMKDLHARLGELRDLPDPLQHVAADIARDIRVLCLDELFVSDIADAMLLGGLFAGLFERGVTLVFTSNLPPSQLYRDGLQRQRFLPAIAAIERQCEVINVDGGEDYRLRLLEKAPLYLDARLPDTHRQLETRFADLCGGDTCTSGQLAIEGRNIPFVARADEVVWFEFDAICDGPRSQADFVEIARDFHTVLISGLPQMDQTRDNPARRFIALVDEFYDRGVKLVLSAYAPVDELYVGERLRFEFDRTRSRLAEMQTHEYLSRPHRP